MKQVTNEFMDLLRDMLNRAFRVGHRTFWHSGSNQDHLVFFSFHGPTAKRAIEVLRAADCLCGTNLGETQTCWVTEDVPESKKRVACEHSAQSWSKDSQGRMFCDDCESEIVFDESEGFWFRV